MRFAMYDPDLAMAVSWARRIGESIPFRCAPSELAGLNPQLDGCRRTREHRQTWGARHARELVRFVVDVPEDS